MLKSGEADKWNDLPGGYKENKRFLATAIPGQKPRLSDRDIDATVAFLRTLTDKGMQ